MEGRGRSRTPKRIRASANNTPVASGYPTPRSMSRSRSRSRSASASRVRTSAAGHFDNSTYAAAGVSRINRGLRLEHKTFDALGSNTVGQLLLDTSTAVADSANGFLLQGAAATASAVVLNQVPQGTTNTTRIARFMQMKKIRLIGSVSASSTATIQQVRFALVYIPVVDRSVTVLPPHNVIWGAQNARNQRVIDNVERFRVLKQWTYVLTGNSATPATGQEIFGFDDMVDLKDLETSWTQTDTTGVFTNMECGALCLYGHGTAAAGTTAASLNYSSRLYFRDI